MKKQILISLLFTCSLFGQVGINTNNPQAILDISSNESGILIPRLSDIQRNSIITPTNSELIYNSTSNEFQYFFNGVWKSFSVTTNGYKSYVAKLTQNGTQVPQVIIIENTANITLTWSRLISGKYIGVASSNVFPINKRFSFIGTSTAISDADQPKVNHSISFNGMGENGVVVFTGLNGILADGLLYETEIEIRIYN